MKQTILQFINAIRKTDRYIETIYMDGSCYQFHLLLKMLFPGCKAYINKEKNHVITKHANKYYDITGEVSGNNYTPITEKEINKAKEWGFYKTNMIKIAECPCCEEPILI